MDVAGQTQLISTQLEVHDQRQLEIELDYHPAGTGPRTEYQIDTTLFIPRSLNVDEATWPRDMFYRDLHNYVRLKTPSMPLADLQTKPASPLRQLEAHPWYGLPEHRKRIDHADPARQQQELDAEMIYDAKMLACVFRGALRGAARQLRRAVRAADRDAATGIVEETLTAVNEIARRFRVLVDASNPTPASAPAPHVEPMDDAPRSATFGPEDSLIDTAAMAPLADDDEATRANEATGAPDATDAHPHAAGPPPRVGTALRLVDEYMSLNIEEYLRRMVVNLGTFANHPEHEELRRKLMGVVLTDETYRRDRKLPSIIEPTSDNEAYTHRLSQLKKYCQNILFLRVQRSQARKAWEEVFVAIAAGAAMAIALSITLAAHSRLPQVSFNFFLIAIVSYILRDRIKDGLRNFLYRRAGKYLYERTTRILDPVTRDEVGICQERVDYGADVKLTPEIHRLRSRDELALAVQAELPESIIRYRKVMKLNSEILPRLGDGMTTGITDIIRLNVDRLLYDMDDPEYIIDYVDTEDMSVEKLRAAKSYRVDVVFRFAVDDGTSQVRAMRLVQLVLDRNGIKRMHQGPWVREE